MSSYHKLVQALAMVTRKSSAYQAGSLLCVQLWLFLNIFAYTFVVFVIIFGDFLIRGQALAAPLLWLSLWLQESVRASPRVVVLHLIFQFCQPKKIS